MRIVVFTALPDIEVTPWWPVITGIPGVDAVLIVQKTISRKPAVVLRRLWKNVRKHGWVFVPYRVAALVRSLVTDLFRADRSRAAPEQTLVDVRTLRALDVHHPFVIETVQDWNPDLGVSIGAPILRPELFAIPPRGTLNVHLGKMPEFRGAPPGFWELWFGATEIGATVHWVDAGLDTGAIIESASAPVYERDTLGRVEARAAELGYSLLGSAMQRVIAGDAQGSPQPQDGRTNRMPTLAQRFTLWRRVLRRRIRSRLTDPLALGKLVVTFAWLTWWRPVRDLLRTLTGGHPVRVFTYHRVTDLCRDGMTVPESTFRVQLEYIRRHHLVVDLDYALDLLAPGRRLRQPVAVITFDDGYRSVGRVAQPAMKALDMPGTCFVCTDITGTDRRLEHDAGSAVRDHMQVMDWSELERLRRSGWRIGAHTRNHPRLSALDSTTLLCEVLEPRLVIRERMRAPRVAMAYPFGGQDDVTTEGILAAKKAGYSALASNFGGENLPGDDPFALKRIDVGGDHDRLMWKASMHGFNLTAWRRRMRGESASGARGSSVAKSRAAAKPLRVTHIVFDLDGGGMESLVAEMAERWLHADIVMSVITLSGRVGRVGERVRTVVEQFHVPRLTPGLSMVAPGALMRAIRSTKPDVVHVHTGAWFKSAYAAKLAGVGCVVYTEHGREHSDPAHARVQDRVASLCTDRVVAVSDRLREYMARAVGVNARKIITIPNGVDTARFAPGPPDAMLRRSLDIPENALVVGSVGRLEPVKAYARLIAAFSELRGTDFGRPLVLVIFGEGSARETIERELDRLGVREGVRMPGWTDQPADGYRLLDLFAMTSTSEGMSVSLMEAMACGACPVVTDVGANAEVMGPELRTHVVAPGEHDQLVRVMRRLLESETQRAAAGACARRRVSERYSVAAMMERYERLYRGAAIPVEPHVSSPSIDDVSPDLIDRVPVAQ